MSIVNRRNAMIGWATWTLLKRTAAMKAKRAAPTPSDGGSPKGKKAVKAGAAVAAAAGLVLFWRAKKRDSTDHDSLAGEGLDTPLD
jgi:ferric-dicitrate binding protein FerR (iron transport regulator)